MAETKKTIRVYKEICVTDINRIINQKQRAMKNLMSSLLIIAMMNLTFMSCETKEKEENTPPELPPYESMAIDFDQFTVKDEVAGLAMKSTDEGTMNNWEFASGQVGFWNLLLTVTLAVPVSSFYHSFAHTPVYLGDATWQWTYEVTGFTSTYIARLVGTVRSEDVKWEMYITKDGIEGYPEFLWYEGVSDLDGNGGQWTLYHSYEFQEEVLVIDWERSGEEVAGIRYSFVRELNDNRETEPFNGSYLEAGLLEDDLNAYYNIHFYEGIFIKDFVDVMIEWSTSEYNGRVKAEYKFGDADWHCWDGYGYDTECN
jgi:hypothetical protein